MKNLTTIIFFVISCSFSYSQDKLLTKKSDTLIVKIISLETEKVKYLLANDKTLTNQFAEKSTLHKIIWRNGKELIFDNNFEMSLLKEIEEKKKQTQIVEAVPIKKQVSSKISYKQTTFTNFYENDEHVSKYRIKDFLKFYDKKNYQTFQEGINLINRANKLTGSIGVGAFITYTLFDTYRSTTNLKPRNFGQDLIASFRWGVATTVVTGIVTIPIKSRGVRLMRESVDNYNKKAK